MPFEAPDDPDPESGPRTAGLITVRLQERSIADTSLQNECPDLSTACGTPPGAGSAR